MADALVRFAVATPPPPSVRPEPYAAQLALARVHSRLVPLIPELAGYAIDQADTHDWYELVPGRGLAGYGLARALRLLLDLLSALSALHDTATENGKRFSHGEFVPALVRVDRSGRARLVPLAPWHWSAPNTPPSPDRVGHLAPERLLGDTIDPRADVFSAGVLLWEALAGCRLFESDSSDAIIMRLMGGRVTLPALPPELPWALPLKEVAMRALAVDPEQRFPSAADFSEAIETVAVGHIASHAEIAAYFAARDPHERPSLVAPPIPVAMYKSSLSALVSPVGNAEVAQAAEAAAPESSAPSRSSRVGLWAAAAGVSLLLAIGAGVATRGAARPPATLASAALGARPIAAPLLPASAPSVLSPATGAAGGAPSPSINVSRPAEPAAAAAAAAPAAPAAPTDSTLRGPTKGPKSVKGIRSNPQLKAPMKPGSLRDKEAEQYGI